MPAAINERYRTKNDARYELVSFHRYITVTCRISLASTFAEVKKDRVSYCVATVVSMNDANPSFALNEELYKKETSSSIPQQLQHQSWEVSPPLSGTRSHRALSRTLAPGLAT